MANIITDVDFLQLRAVQGEGALGQQMLNVGLFVLIAIVVALFYLKMSKRG